MSLGLTGCSSFTAIPDVTTGTPVGQTRPGSFQGKVMGGHAAIVGAEVFVFQAGQGGYASAPTNEMTSGYAGTDPTYGNYVLTGVNGSFSVTGDYTCTSGHPVYVAAVGGTASTSATLVQITGSSVTHKNGVYTITFTGANSLAAGNSVSFANGAFTSARYTFLNGTTQTVSAATGTTFSITTNTTVSGSATGYALANGVNNPAIVNIAVLGNCPGSNGEFNNTLSFVYIDEVSTTAAAYALNAFGTGFDAIGAPTTNLAGIARAATNAGQLYNINDNTSSNAGNALATTSYVGGSNGIVPQATLNTVANILASCVDSTNTSTTTSDQCSTLFATATSTGDTTGTKPTDISSAAFNIAAYPAGTGSQSGTFPDKLFALQGSGATPFVPNLAAAPNDFGVAIVYPTSLNSHVGNAESVAIDGNGQIWTTAQTDTSITLWSPVGKVVDSHSSGYIYGYVSVDPSNNAWTGSASTTSGIQKFSNTGTLSNTFGNGYQSAYTVITNQSNNNDSIDAYFFAGGSTQYGYWYTPNGNNGNGGFSGPGPAGPYAATGNFVAHGAIDSTGDLWLTSEAGQSITRVVPNTGNFLGFGNGFATARNFPIATPTVNGATYQPQPEFPAIDASNNAWIPLQTTYSATGTSSVPGLEKVATNGSVVSYYSGTGTNTGTRIYTGANFYQSFGAAVDGNGNVWITNRYNPGLGGNASAPGASTLIELKGSNGTAISPSTNYTYGGVLNDCLNLAIDQSGNLWVTNYNGSELVEILGQAGPVVAPLSAAANAGELATLP